MSHYTLPKNNNNINICIKYSNNPCDLYISHSLFSHYNKSINEAISLFENENEFNESQKIIHPYDFLHSKVPGYNYPVSKLSDNDNSNLFYDFIEMSMYTNIFDFKYNMQSIHISNNRSVEENVSQYKLFKNLIKMVRSNDNDRHNICNDSNLNELDNLGIWSKDKDFIYYELDKVNYDLSLISMLAFLFKNQKVGGNAIIKIDHIFTKPTADMLYILSSLYEKVSIFKPTTNAIVSSEKYVICKQFKANPINYNFLFTNIDFIKSASNVYIKCLLQEDIPYYFKTKLDDINIVIGHQQLDALDQIISIYKNKNKEDKIEGLKRINIQKSICWCEKYKIPYNKFEKSNIFLCSEIDQST
jgi:hypothetical protein